MKSKQIPSVRINRIARIVTLASRRGRYGGPFDTALNQSAILGGHGHEVHLVAGFLRDDRPDIATSSDNVRLSLSPIRGPWSKLGPSGLLSSAICLNLYRTIRNSDIVHISFAREPVPLIAALLALILEKNSILQPHGMITTGRARSRFLDPLLRFLVKRCTHLIALTDREAEQLGQWCRCSDLPITVIGNPLPAGGVDPIQNDMATKEALFIARLAPRKNVSHFIEGASIAGALDWAEKYSIVGPDGGDLEQVMTAAGKLENLRYEGAITGSKVATRIGRASVVVMTSSDEPWGNSIATAIASGVPVVIPRSAALAQLVETHGAGEIYPDGDVNDLAHKIHRMINDDEARARTVEGCAEFTREVLCKSQSESALLGLYAKLQSKERC